MVKHKLAVALSFACVTAVVLGSTRASAEALSGRGTETVTEHVVPSGSMLAGGLVTFALSYGPAVGVAATSSLPEDHHLFVPIAGPWIDLGNRGDCGGSCDTETTYRVLLVVDGVVQGLSALTVIGAFFTPESRTVTRSVVASEPRLRIAPASMGSGYGVLATGRF